VCYNLTVKTRKEIKKMTVTTTATIHFTLNAEEVKTLRKAHEILYKMYEQTKEETDIIRVEGFTEYDPNEPEDISEFSEETLYNTMEGLDIIIM
jgi:hypothetical protein